MKTTEELLNALQQMDINAFWEQHQDELIHIAPHEFLQDLIEKSGKKKAEIINTSEFDTVYFYQILAGSKIPSRDKLLRILIALQCTFSDCQLALRMYNHAVLYPRVKRDSCLIYCINNHFSLSNTLEELQKCGEAGLK